LFAAFGSSWALHVTSETSTSSKSTAPLKQNISALQSRVAP